MNRNGQRRTIPSQSPEEVWTTTYASLAMIMVVFFVMLVSYSHVSGRSAVQIRAALSGKGDQAAGTAGPVAPAAVTVTGEQEAVAGARLLAEAGGILRGALDKANLSRDVVLERTRSGWRMVLGMNALFDGGRGKIRESMHPFLREVGTAAMNGNLAVRVEAFGAAAGGRAGSSWAAPSLQAAEVIDFLERDGVRSPLSIRGSRAARQATGPAADAGGELVISVSLPEVAR
ncbi:MAG: hypothetical protein HPY65_09595 [Syntrophaceae bacterium]|nr:hypothetical protein [Syntrophaceae bacterium]